MHEFLKFPSKNYVGKRLSNQRYIKSANLTSSEERWLAAHLDSIEILYSFPFTDGEIIVLLTDYSSVTNSKFSLNNFVKAVAQSLPYKILLVVRCEGVIRFFSFDEKINFVNNRRSRVISVNSSLDIIPIEDDYFDNKLIEDLREAAVNTSTAKDLNQRWNYLLSGHYNDSNSVIEDTFRYSLDKYYTLSKKKKTFDKLTSGEITDDLDYECLLYEGTPLEIDEVDHRFFVEFCAYYARLLFDESSTLYTSLENEWLKIYLDGCNSYAEDVFNRVLDCRSVEMIARAFWDDSEDYTEAADSFDLEELKEHIDDYYFQEEQK